MDFHYLKFSVTAADITNMQYLKTQKYDIKLT
jgi:hypothetical protein